MGGITGFQDFWVAGSHVFFKRDPISGVDQPVQDFGTIKSSTPSLEVTEVELKDAACGHATTVAKQVVDMTESYAIVCSNFNPEMLSLLLMAEPPEDFTQSATPVTSISQDPSHKGYLLKIRDGSGDPIYNLASIDLVKDSADVITYVLDTDYEIVDLSLGIIRILDTPGAIVENDELLIDYTPVALSGKRMVKPQTQSSIEGEIFVYISRDGCAEQSVRHGRVSLAPAGANITAEDFSDLTLNATILADLTAADPAGEMLYFNGDVPDPS